MYSVYVILLFYLCYCYYYYYLLFLDIYRPKVNIVCLSFFKFSLSSSLAKSMLYKIMPFHTIFCTKLKKKSAIPYYTLYLRKYRTSSIINIRFCLRFFTLINIRIRKEFLVILRACSPGQNFEVFKYYTPEK